MKACVILEPFPIRNSFASFAWIGNRFAEMYVDKPVGAQSDLNIACNHSCFNYICSKTPRARPALLMYDSVSLGFFDRLLMDWSTCGLDIWKSIQRGDEQWVYVYANLLERVIERSGANVLIYWGTNRTLSLAAASLGAHVVYCEYGPVRAPLGDVFCLDSSGVNGDAWMRKLDVNSLPKSDEPSKLDMLRQFQVGKHTAHDLRLEWHSDFSPVFSDIVDKMSKHDLSILLPLQLADDANVIRFSNGYTMKQILAHVLETLPSDNLLLVKTHPGASESFYNLDYYTDLRHSCAQRSNIEWLDAALHDSEYISLLSLVDICITLNSSLAFEASIFGAKVVVFGQASYVPEALAHLHGVESLGKPQALDRRVVRFALDHYFLPSDTFWSYDGFFSALCKESVRAGWYDDMIPSFEQNICAPKVGFRDLGTSWIDGGCLKIERLGNLTIEEQAVEGALDRFEIYNDDKGERIYLSGWAVCLLTQGPVVGIIIRTSQHHCFWLSSAVERVDVARHRGFPQARLSGFATRLYSQDVPQLVTDKVDIYCLLSNDRVGKLHGHHPLARL